MTPTVEHALQIIGLVVVTSWFITLGIAAVLWIREDWRKHQLEKRATERLTFPETWTEERRQAQAIVDFERAREREERRFREMEW